VVLTCNRVCLRPGLLWLTLNLALIILCSSSNNTFLFFISLRCRVPWTDDRCSSECGSLDVSQPYGPPQTVTELQLSRYSDWLRAVRPRGRSSSPCRGKNFHFSASFKRTLGPTQPTIHWVTGPSPGVKRKGREADHASPTSAEVKKTWIHTSTPPYAFMA
jgi:hypothetical protein